MKTKQRKQRVTQLASVTREAAFYRKTLEQVCDDTRNTRGKRLASSAITFWDQVLKGNMTAKGKHLKLPKASVKSASKVKPLSSATRRNIFNLCIAGQMLSNIAYNWKQDTNRPESERQMLAECQKEWDAARDKLPRWTHSK